MIKKNLVEIRLSGGVKTKKCREAAIFFHVFTLKSQGMKPSGHISGGDHILEKSECIKINYKNRPVTPDPEMCTPPFFKK